MADGILFIDKEAGMTSRKLDNQIGKLFHTHKVGHLGTLDPFATGLLIVGVNSGNKALRFALDEEKEYVATLNLGVATSTGDYTGQQTEHEEIPLLPKNQVSSVVKGLVGKMKQIPPMTSAIKVGGVALYRLAHEGKEIQREAREIEVKEAKLLSYGGDELTFQVLVSKGTYIRTLGEDLAKRLGTVGHLTALRRTAIGPFRVENAVKLEDIGEESLQNPLVLLDHMEQHECQGKELFKVANGASLDLPCVSPIVLLTHENQALAVYERKQGDHYICLRGLA